MNAFCRLESGIMKLNIRGKKLEVTDAIRSHIEKKILKLDKFFKNNEEFEASVVIKTDGRKQIVEITLPIKKVVFRAEEESSDLYVSVDKAVDKIERQIRKNKTRLNHKKYHFDEIFEDYIEEEEENNDIVRRKSIKPKPMNEKEAILQMELLGHDFFMFESSKTGCVSLLYKRKDNNYGVITMEKCV